MKKHIRYLIYILKHKWYVFIECRKLEIPWLGITHDWSKFRPSEWFPYAQRFYGEGLSADKFDYAWLLHQKRNKHHWQFWILKEDIGGEKVLEMPLKYRKEMLADWRGASRNQYGKDNTKEWYHKRRDMIIVGKGTGDWFDYAVNPSNFDATFLAFARTNRIRYQDLVHGR